jgi:GTP-binding protein Era
LTEKQNKKCLTVALAGIPNAGKSTLMNNLVGEKISIVSPKVQTTRDLIRGILVENNSQIIFIDTPGIFTPKKARMLEKKIVKTAWTGIMDAEVVCLLIDVIDGLTHKVKVALDNLKKRDVKAILILNKVDLIHKPKLLELTKEITTYYPDFDKVFMISAKNGHGVNDLKNYLIEIAPKGEWIYPEDDITDVPMKFMASEITREKLFNALKEELPYSIDVVTENWEEFKNGDIKINQVIYVLKENQKNIIVGKRGERIKKINIEARQEISKLTERKVHLFLFVKVKEDWIAKKW